MHSIKISKEIVLSDFARDTLSGLSEKPKRLSSKYFYDRKGDALFQDIMHMPEYYLTDAEFEIFQNYAGEILSFATEKAFDLIELGAGDGLKTKVLLTELKESKADFRYIPVDISQNALTGLKNDLQISMPEVNVQTRQGDYFAVLEDLKHLSSRQKLVLFLGSNIGNYTREEARNFLSHLSNALVPGDRVLLGVDLKKDPAVIQAAYDDAAGITAAFNLNLLERMNRELGADFVIENFKHWETYNPVTGETKSYIVSKKEQAVNIADLDKSFNFEAWEAIWVELSQKYSTAELEELFSQTGFTVEKYYSDSKNYFSDVMLKVS